MRQIIERHRYLRATVDRAFAMFGILTILVISSFEAYSEVPVGATSDSVIIGLSGHLSPIDPIDPIAPIGKKEPIGQTDSVDNSLPLEIDRDFEQTNKRSGAVKGNTATSNTDGGTESRVRRNMERLKALAGESKNMDVDSMLQTTILPPVRDITEEASDEFSTDDNTNRPFDYINKSLSDHIEGFIALFIFILFMALLPILIIIFVIRMILRARLNYQRERLRMLENMMRQGYRIPDGFSINRGRFWSRRQAFSSALKWLGTGIGLLLFFWIVASFKMAFIISIVPLVIGAVKTILYFSFDRYDTDEEWQHRSPLAPPCFTGLKEKDAQKAYAEDKSSTSDIR